MKKKVYNTPVMEVAVMMPTTIICASITGGDPVTSLDPDPSYGDYHYSHPVKGCTDH